MEKNRGYKIIILLSLVFSFVGLTLGFAAMTNDEKFSENMKELDEEMNNFVSYINGTTKEINALYATTNPGVINGNSWSGISVSIEKSGGYATLGASIKNTADIATANLETIYTTEAVKCYKVATNLESPEDCQDVNIVVTIGNSRMELNSASPSMYNITNNQTTILPGKEREAIITINYNQTNSTNIGDFKVIIPTIYYSFAAITQ